MMEYPYDCLFDDEATYAEDQIRSIAQKSWLSTASASLAHLDNVTKAKVYNFGLADPRDLKATNLRDRRTSQPNQDAALTNSAIAWGSNNSIPDLMKQQGADESKKSSRPASAKYSSRRSRPPSGKKPRPQSAKEPLPQTSEVQQAFGVKGAKYDPAGRPPKGVHVVNTTGWVGPPAGLRYPDKPPPGSGWKIDFPSNDPPAPPRCSPETVPEAQEIPPPPNATPMPPSPEPEPERPKRIFELFIGDPYNTGNGDDELLESDSDEELFVPPTPVPSSTPVQPSPASTQPSTTPMSTTQSPGPSDGRESLKLELPVVEDDYDEIDDMDTERLLAEAEFVANKFDLKQVISINQNLSVSEGPGSENVESGSVANRPVHALEIDKSIKKKAEVLVSEIIDESGLKFEKIPESDKVPPVLEHEKSSVKFNEEVRTVDITPRNIGRKVEELHLHKKKSHELKENDFVDLIQVKSRLEPVLSAGKADVAPKQTRPGSAKSHASLSTHSKSSTDTSQRYTGQNNLSNHGHIPSAPTCHKSHGTQPRPRALNEPLNRQAKPVTTVTVDYGEAEEKKKSKPRKTKRNPEDVHTMMEQISLAEKADRSANLTQNSNNNSSQSDNGRAYEVNTHVPTVYKSGTEKNYYEIGRHSSMSNHSMADGGEVKPTVITTGMELMNTVYKTTKTIEFDELQPRETTIKSVIDPLVRQTKDLDKFLTPQTLAGGDMKEKNRPRFNSRPASAKPPVSKKHPEESEGRPGSRLGFVAMTPDKPDQKTKPRARPSSAPSHRQPKSGMKNKETIKEALKDHVKKSFKESFNDNLKNDMDGIKAGVEDEVKDGATDVVKDKDATKDVAQMNVEEEPVQVTAEDREKIIDNLIERTKGLAGDRKENVEDIPEAPKSVDLVKADKKKTRPVSAHVGLAARTREQLKLKGSANKRPASATTIRHLHRHSSGQCKSATGSRKSSGKTRTVLTEPCIINTNTDYYEEETEEDLACQKMERDLSERGVNINAATLQRALYPPSGKSKYYQITADLPKRPSLNLLSHPKVWLPEEYKTLQRADKNLARANEIMFIQKKAEERKAKLESMSQEEREKLKKKKGKKGKKGGKKLRKSLTVG